MATKIYTFGFRYGIPDGVSWDAVIDVRDILRRNPFAVPNLKAQAGDTRAVLQWFQDRPGVWGKALQAVRTRLQAIPDAAYIGCTGGRHRSVAIAHTLGRELGIPVEHLDKERPRWEPIQLNY